MPNCIALLGAGFSRNWGGWLASEAFEYLLGCPEVDEDLRHMLWNHSLRGGFESALAELQSQHERSGRSEPEPKLRNLQNAVGRMFRDMDKGFESLPSLEFHNDRKYQVKPFLARFDAIFTLNQDLLLERKYLTDNLSLLSPRGRWAHWQMPGVPVANPNRPYEPIHIAETGSFDVHDRKQPYFKLHGSSNWTDHYGDLLVVGGEKASTIMSIPLLKWYSEQFVDYLGRPDTRLLVIGYGFGDAHINDVIRRAIRRTGLTLFLIDPLGTRLLAIDRDHISDPEDLHPGVVGASRRSLGEIFKPDPVEWGKLMRFIDAK